MAGKLVMGAHAMEEDSEDQDHQSVDLGFAEKCDKKIYLSSLFYPSKIGGRPAWLRWDSLPKPEDLQCGNCGKQLVLLCQIYVPMDLPVGLSGVMQPFHRTLYLFCCRDGPCSKFSTSVKAFRAERQHLPSDPNYDDSDLNEVELTELCYEMEKPHNLCNLCGCRGDKKCSSCHGVRYCSKQHQAVDWKHRHKKECHNNGNGLIQQLENIKVNDDNKELAKHPIFFQEYEIVIEAEPEAPRTTAKMAVEEEYPEASKPADRQLEKDLRKLESQKVDETFAHFRERIDREPEQVIRYDIGKTPLWVSSANAATQGNIPRCPACGSERQFEFQVLPQMINYLGVETTMDSIDFGTLCVYTCARNCVEGEAYKEEFVWKQDFSS